MNSYEEIITDEDKILLKQIKYRLKYIFEFLEENAKSKVRQERSLFPYPQNYRKEYNKILKNNDFIKRINENSIEKANKRFHERTPKGYWINQDCWNIIKSYILKTDWISQYPVGMKLLKCLQSKENLRLGYYIQKIFCKKIKKNYFDDISGSYGKVKIIEVVNWTEYNVMIVEHYLIHFENFKTLHQTTNIIRCRIKNEHLLNMRFQNNSQNIQYYFEDLYELSREKFEELKTD